MIVYAESSAVLAWLLREPGGDQARQELETAERVVSSRLTVTECERAFVRAMATSRLPAQSVDAARHLLAQFVPSWSIVEVTAEILREAGRPFPHESLRTLDAVHLSTISFLRAALPELRVLSLDDRVRRCAGMLGFDVLPAAGA